MASDPHKSITEIINKYQSHITDDFDDRWKAFEDYHNPENHDRKHLEDHAKYVIHGNPGDEENYPGAKNEVIKKLYDKVKKKDDEIESEDDAKEIMDAFVDEFLRRAMSDYDEVIDELKKDKDFTDEKLRDHKEVLMRKYFVDGEGNPLDIYKQAKNMYKKQRHEAQSMLEEVASSVEGRYKSILSQKPITGLIKEHDTMKVHGKTTDKLGEAGWKHEEHPLTKGADTLANIYGAWLRGIDMQKIPGMKRTDTRKKSGMNEGDESSEEDGTSKDAGRRGCH